MDTRRESVQVLDADPGLGEGLSPAQLSVAARLVVASVLRLGTGVWDFEVGQVPDAGFLLVQGCITREVVILGETAAIEFLAEVACCVLRARPVGLRATPTSSGRSWRPPVLRCSTATSCSACSGGRR